MKQITFKPSWKQHLAWQALEDSIIEEVVYGGAAGGGKSYFGCWWKITRRLRYPGSRGVIGRAVLNSIRESTLITYYKVLGEMGLEADRDYTFNATHMYFEFNNGSREIFKELSWQPGDPDYARFGSLEVTDAWIEEDFDKIEERAFDILKSRIRWKLDEFGLIPKILLTCNPGYNWLRAKYVKNAEDQPVVLKPWQKFIQANVNDNPNKSFVKIYKASLEKMSGYDRERLLEGDWDAVEQTGDEFYSKWAEVHVNEFADRYDPEHPIHITFDFNLAPHMTLNIWQVWGTEAVQIDEICLAKPHNSTPATCKRFALKYAGHKAEIFVYGDPAGKQGDTRNEEGHNDYTIVWRELKSQFRLSNRVQDSAPSVSMRGLFINEILEKEYEGISIRVDRRCKITIQDYGKVQKASDGTKHKKKVKDSKSGVTYEPYGHSTDANDYFLTTIFKDQYKRFQERKKALPTIGNRYSSSENSY
jgi:phage terminase large subunit